MWTHFKKNILLILMLAITPLAHAQTITYPKDQTLYDRYPWAVTYYYGYTVNNPLVRVFLLYSLDRWPESIQSLELTHTLNENNVVRRFFSPVVGVVQINANATLRNGKGESRIYEFDPYISWRWANLPWNQYVNTSFAIGEGISYVSSVPAIERIGNNNMRHLLNYLMFEATFAPPSYPRLQFVARIHHRSGAFGLYQADNSGSNDIGFGIKYLFD
ncbi:MAG: hypothetical protein ACYC0J_04075 [Gammaproteobacteria bacterium]